ncbi:MAG TPA: hypothetical protein VER83_09055, partial [Candidatus Nanopelagicales bacterium]|nr:hypothetical protein [Candidatus Nanopelagicales bacterium]
MDPADRTRPSARRPVTAPARRGMGGASVSSRGSRSAAPRPPAAVRAEATPIAAPAGGVRRRGPDTVIVLAILGLTAL